MINEYNLWTEIIKESGNKFALRPNEIIIDTKCAIVSLIFSKNRLISAKTIYEKEVNNMIITNLGMTKEEMIYQLALRVSMDGKTKPFDIICKAIEIYNELINRNIIKEEILQK